MPSDLAGNLSPSSFSNIPSMDDLIALSENVMTGFDNALSDLDKALSKFEETVSELHDTSRKQIITASRGQVARSLPMKFAVN